MTVDGIDISNHQPRWRPGAEKFVYILATDGHSWYSPTHANQVRLARDDGKRVGHYHWLRPGNIQEQVDWFWAHAKPLPGDALICDWEQSGTSNADKDEFLKQLDAKIPRTKLLRKRRMPRALYCNRNYWLNYDRTGFVGEGLWIAEYGVAKPGITYPWTFWQFADGPTTDRNHSIFQTLTEYDDWAEPSDGSQPHPAPVTDFVPVPPTLGAIHTPYGAWARRGRGTVARTQLIRHGGSTAATIGTEELAQLRLATLSSRSHPARSCSRAMPERQAPAGVRLSGFMCSTSGTTAAGRRSTHT
jgi:hypothetical protein